MKGVETHMSSVNGVSSSRSLYGTRNVITGLASGMDTESMIENAISGYKNKINTLTQKRTKVEWQQEAYRNIVTKMAGFSSKYADYQSSTNLMSPSFFNQAVTVASQGANASKVSASGKTGSDIQINAVKQLARAATYRVSGGVVGNNPGVTSVNNKLQATASDVIDLTAMKDISTVAGSMTIAYGGSDARSYLDIKFGELDVFSNAQQMADAINKQLEDQTVNTSNGATIKASEMLKAKVENGSVVFDGQGNDAYIASISGDGLKSLFNGATPGKDLTSFQVDGKDLSEKTRTSNYLSNATMKITLDGVTKTIKMPTLDDIVEQVKKSDYQYKDALATKIKNGDELTNDASKAEQNKAYIAALQKNIDAAFGKLDNDTGKSKLEVGNASSDKTKLQLQFTSGQEGSTFSVSSDKAKAMGFTDDGLNSYFNTNMTLKDLLGTDADGNLNGVEGIGEGDDRVYSFQLNGVEIGKFTKDTSLTTIMSRINGNAEAGVNVSYSKTTNEFTFTAKDTGVSGKMDFGNGLDQLFGKIDFSAGTSDKDGKFIEGRDAIFTATINGSELKEITRSSNTIDLDGLSVNLKGTFGYDEAGNVDSSAEAVSFKSSTDADTIVDAIKSMVEDYNAMVTEIKNAYSTLPVQRSNKSYYEPLTDEDKEDMSESAITAWEEKAKTGILFGDNDLASLYTRLTRAVSMTGKNGDDLKAAGISVNYANNLTTLSLNENQLRATLETDPDRVMELFTKTKSSGADSDGLMQAIKEPLELYGKTTGVNLTTGTKGVLVNKAGHPLAPSTMYNNTIQQQLDKIDQEIAKWQDKMSDQVDSYTQQFAKLEQLISQMNSQSSAIAGFLGQ